MEGINMTNYQQWSQSYFTGLTLKDRTQGRLSNRFN